MIKKLLSAVGILYAFAVQSQIINIPDGEFKGKLLMGGSGIAADADGNFMIIDTNFDDQIQQSEALAVYYLILEESLIGSLEGIQYFTNLRSLDVSSNSITSVDLSTLTNLTAVDLSFNQLTTLDLSGKPALSAVHCQNNQLTVLNLSGSNMLDLLECQNNQLTALTAAFDPATTQVDYVSRVLDCSHNQLTSLNVTGYAYRVNCTYNQLATLDVTPLSDYIRILDCSFNPLTQLNISDMFRIEQIDCNATLLSEINFNASLPVYFEQLNVLSVVGNQLTSLNVDNLKNLTWLNCSNNQISFLDITKTKVYNGFRCANNSSLATILMKKTTFPIVGNMNLADLPNLSYVCVKEADIATMQTVINSYGYTNCLVTSNCTFDPGGTFYTMSGTTKYSPTAGNCASGTALPFMRFYITNPGGGNRTEIADASGNYTLYFQSGASTVSPFITGNAANFNATPASRNVNFPTTASPVSQDFCITPSMFPLNDVQIELLPVFPPVAGGNAKYRLVYRNYGNNVQSGTVTLNYEGDKMDLVSSSVTPTTQTANTLTWNFTNLQPMYSGNIDLKMHIHTPMDTPPVNIGDQVISVATVTGTGSDATTTNNTYNLAQTVLASFDPNDKTCVEGAVISPAQVGGYVNYVIRFENTGTANATNVIVTDIIDTNRYEMYWFEPTASSHNFKTRITGDKVEFIFENIDLPFDDANNDGFVAFRIKTKTSLVIGDSFSNLASIYFDYNHPIVTEPAVTTIAVLERNDFEFSDYFAVHPNPAGETLNIESKRKMELSSVKIFNTLGQLVLAIPNAQQLKTIDVSPLQSGNYFLRATSDQGDATVQFIKK